MARVKSSAFVRRFAIASCCLAGIHFLLETAYTVQYGQAFLGLLPDYLADLLLIWGSVVALKDHKATGVLCGAWGFTLCLHYRAWAWRFQSVMDDTANAGDQGTMVVLASTMAVSALCFLLTLLMALPDKPQA